MAREKYRLIQSENSLRLTWSIYSEVFNSASGCILLYTFGLISFTALRFEILDQIDQPQQVLESGERSLPGVDDERVDLTGVGPTRREKGRLPIFGIIKNSPLTPTTPTINKLKLPSAPGMKWVGHPKILFCILYIRCSSRPMPNSKSTTTIITARAGG